MKPISRQRLPIKPLSAFFLSIYLTLFNCFLYVYPASAQAAKPVFLSSSHFHDLSAILLPGELGAIQETFQGTGKEAVILVQDAHTVYEAQKSIQGIIDFFQTQYGLDLIALEGGTGKVDPLFFRSYPNPEALERVFDDYLRNGELSGVLGAAVLNEKEANYYGVEDQALYEKGVLAFLEAQKRRLDLLKRIQGIQKKLDFKKQRIYPRTLLAIDRAARDFEARKIDFAAFLRKLENINHSSSRPRNLNPELFPYLSALRDDLAGFSEADQKAAEKEITRLIRQLGPHLKSRQESMAFNQSLQAYRTGAADARGFGHFLLDLARKKNLAVSSYPELHRKTAAYPLLREMQPPVFFKELDAWLYRLKSPFLKNPRVRKLDAESRRLVLFEKLAKLELTREEWGEVKTRDQGQVTSDLGSVARELFGFHERFYQNAEQRESVFFVNLKKLMDRQERSHVTSHESRVTHPVIFIAGGFHTQGMTRAFREKNISYAVITPRITQIPEESRYLQMMQGDVSWKRYFQIKNGKVNLYKAFVCGARDRLLGMRSSELGLRSLGVQGGKNSQLGTSNSQLLLKAWRDELIRTLAQRGKIEKSGEYTHFIDDARVTGLLSSEVSPRDSIRLFQQTTSAPMVSGASGMPFFETLPRLVGLARSEVREEIPLPRDLKSGVDEIVNAMLAEDFQGAIEKVERFIKSKEGEIHQLTDLRMKRSLLDWSETTREVAEQIRDVRIEAERANGMKDEKSLGDGKQILEEPKQASIIPFSLVDGEMNQLIAAAKKSPEQYVGVIPPLYDLGDWPYYVIAREKAAIERVKDLFAANKNKNIDDAFRMELGELLGYTEEEIAKFFGHIRYPKNRITPVEVRHFWKEPGLGYLKYLVGQYKDVLGIGGEMQRLMGFRALKSESSFYEVAGELISAEMIRNALAEDYQVEILAFGFFVGFREFDTAIRITARNPDEKDRLPLKEGIYFIEAKHDDAANGALENIIEETIYGQVIAQMESLESLIKLGAPVKGIIVAVGGKKSRKRSAALKDLKREMIAGDKYSAVPVKNRPRELLPVYSLILPSYDVENDPLPASAEAFAPDNETVKRWSREPLEIASLLKARLFGNIWPPVNQSEIDAFAELRHRQRERFTLMKRRVGEHRRNILAAAKDEERRDNEVFEWLHLFQEAGFQDPQLEAVLVKYFGKRNRPLPRLRLELFQKWWRHSENALTNIKVQDPAGAWEWLEAQTNGRGKNGVSKTVVSQRVEKPLPLPRQRSSKLPGLEQDEDVEMRIHVEVSGLRDSTGWVASFADRKDVVNESGNPPSKAETVAILSEYFGQVKNQSVGERQKYFSTLRARLQRSIQSIGRQQTWNLLKSRQWDQLPSAVFIRSEVRSLLKADVHFWQDVLEQLNGPSSGINLDVLEEQAKRILGKTHAPGVLSSYFDVDETRDPLFAQSVGPQTSQAARLGLRRGRLRTLAMLQTLAQPYAMKESVSLPPGRNYFVDINPSFGKDMLALLLDSRAVPDFGMVIARPFSGELAFENGRASVKGGWILDNGRPVWVHQFKQSAPIHLFNIPDNGFLGSLREQFLGRGIPEAYGVENELLRQFGHKSAVYELIEEMRLGIRHPKYDLWEIKPTTSEHTLRWNLSAAFEEIGPSLVIKPNAGAGGNGVYFLNQGDSSLFDQQSVLRDALKTAKEKHYQFVLAEEKIRLYPLKISERGELKEMAWAVRVILSRDLVTDKVIMPSRYVRLQEGYIHNGDDARKYWTVEETFDYLDFSERDRHRLNEAMERSAYALFQAIEKKSGKSVPALSVDFFITPDRQIVFNEIGFRFGGRYRHNYVLSEAERQKFGASRLDPYEINRLAKRAGISKRSEIRSSFIGSAFRENLWLVRENPIQFFELLHQIRGRRERVPQIEKTLSFAIHAPLIPDEKEERQEVVDAVLGQEGYLMLPFENIAASRQKSRKEHLASEIYGDRPAYVSARFRPLAFVGNLNYSALEQKIRANLDGNPLITLMADGNLLIPAEKKGKTLVFLVEPEILAVLKLAEVISILQVIGSAAEPLRRFYLEELGLNPDSKTGISMLGKMFINQLSDIARREQSVKMSA